MNVIRSLYRTILPLRLRAGIQYWRSMARHITADSRPDKIEFDSAGYWSQRLEKGNEAISYPEIVDLCAGLLPENARLLDIGCGTGLFLHELGKKKILQARGVDVSERAMEVAKARGVDAVALPANDPNLAALGFFDFVTLFEVLEHIQDAEAVLASVRRSFPTATVIASVPNTGYLPSRLRLLCGRFPRQWIVHPGEHIRFWTLHDFRMMASRLGYQVVRVYPLRGSAVLARWLPGVFGEALVFQMKPVAGPPV